MQRPCGRDELGEGFENTERRALWLDVVRKEGEQDKR